MRIEKASAEEKVALAQVRRRILRSLDVSFQAVKSSILEYGTAFASLAEGQPGNFRTFLINAPARFIPIGESVGVAKHIQSFWHFRFPEKHAPRLAVDEATELFEEFDLALENVAFVRDAIASKDIMATH